MCRTLCRDLGREVSGDEEEASQHWRSIASACRQRAIAAVAKDIEHVDDAVDGAHEEPHYPTTEDVGADSHGFLGGPRDTLVLTSYVDHVATKVWAIDVVISLIITFKFYLWF